MIVLLLLLLRSGITQGIPYTATTSDRFFLTCCKILQHGTDGFTSPLKEVMLQTVMVLKNPSSSATSEPENLGSNGNHNNN
jgi:hypothetical protein